MNFKEPIKISKIFDIQKQLQYNKQKQNFSNEIKDSLRAKTNCKEVVKSQNHLKNDDYTLLQQYVNLDITALQNSHTLKNSLEDFSDKNKNMASTFKNHVNNSPESTISMNECLNQLAQSQFTSDSIENGSKSDRKISPKNIGRKRKFALSLKKDDSQHMEDENNFPTKYISDIKNDYDVIIHNEDKSVLKNSVNKKISNIEYNKILKENNFKNQNNSNAENKALVCLNKNRDKVLNLKCTKSNELVRDNNQSFENIFADDDYIFSNISQYVANDITEIKKEIKNETGCSVENKSNSKSELDEKSEVYFNSQFSHSKQSKRKSVIPNDLTENKNKLNMSNYNNNIKNAVCNKSNSNKIITSTQIHDSTLVTQNQFCNPDLSFILPVHTSKEIEQHDVGNTINKNNKSKMQKNWSQTYEIDLLEEHNKSFLENLSQRIDAADFRKQVEDSFIKCENAIYEIAPGQNESLKKINLENYDHCDQIISSQKNTAENINSFEDSISSQTLINFECTQDIIQKDLEKKKSENIGLGDKIKTTLLNNARNFSLNETTQLSFILNSDMNFKTMGPFYGLPLAVKDLIFQFKGIEQLYEWQDECLNLDAVNKHKNLIYALPTSGGKTLVAEILLLREMICRKKNVLFILPYVSIVQEKVWSLSPFAVALDFLVEQYASSKGSYPPRKRRHKNTVYIATIEKGLGLVNSLLEEGRLGEIGLVIVDEFHLIGESKRGSNLEMILIKLLFSREDIQIIGMSATIGNLQELSSFLHAEIYTQSFRPVELQEFVKCGSKIASINWNANDENLLVPARQVDYKYPDFISKIDPDHLGGLVMEVIPDASCLIFCPSKQNCENVALLLCKVLFRQLLEHQKIEKENLIASLESEGKICPVLAKTIPFGVAYHHSGLTIDERKIIEDAFRTGILSVICCTSTLAAGVNLPAKRVILRSPYIARDFITLARYKQMVGRAGRAGLGEVGESILLCTEKDIPRIKTLLTTPMDNVISQMNKTDGLISLILSSIGLKIATTIYDLQNLMKISLISVQAEYLNLDVSSLVHENVNYLIELRAITVKQNYKLSKYNKEQKCTIENEFICNKKVDLRTELEISKLGSAAIKGNMNLNLAQILYEDLVIAQSSLVLLDSLHLLYLVTPYDLAEQIRPTMSIYYKVFTELKENELKAAQIIGITESCAVKMMIGQKITKVPERVLNRFYLTLILYELWNQSSLFDTSEKYKVNRGIIQQLMQGASSFASNVVRFCEEFEEFWAFTHLLKDINSRLAYCCTPEILPLMDLPAVKKNRAKQLYLAGYKNLQSIAKANPNDLMNLIKYLNRSVANQLIAAAKLLLLERVETLKEEAEEVLEGLQSKTNN